MTATTGPRRRFDTTAGIVAIGHSGLTAENSDSDRPGRPALDNSWATGTSTEVDSIYLRLVAALPETEGNVVNAATGGAPVHALRQQAATGGTGGAGGGSGVWDVASS